LPDFKKSFKIQMFLDNTWRTEQQDVQSTREFVLSKQCKDLQKEMDEEIKEREVLWKTLTEFQIQFRKETEQLHRLHDIVIKNNDSAQELRQDIHTCSSKEFFSLVLKR
jgi:predicted nuclease with TOPRIM domain